MSYPPPNEPRSGITVQCVECAHTWTGFYLPMAINDVAKVVKGLACPMCAADAKKIRIALLGCPG